MGEVNPSAGNNDVLVSVIIPTYNRADLLPRAIRSVLGQTHTNLECIVVDDGSTDGTAQVVKGFADGRLVYLCHETNRGGSAARNTGIRHASGDYIALLDSDDEWLPDKLAKQLLLMQGCSGHVGVVHCTFYALHDATGQRFEVKEPLDFCGGVYQTILQGQVPAIGSSALVRSECFETCGPFDETLTSFQDYDMWLRIARRYRFECVREPLAIVHVHGGSQVSMDFGSRSAGLERILSKWGPEIRRERGARGYRELERYFSVRMYTNATREYVRTGDLRSAARCLGHVVWLQPANPRLYLRLALEVIRGVGARLSSR